MSAAAAGMPLGQKQSYFTPESTYHGGPGEGHGIRQFNSGQHFDGHWKDEEQEGRGSLTTKEGTSYHGDWSKGMMHGQGKYTFLANPKAGGQASGYDGEWSEGQFHGRGKLVLYSGNSYDGEWRKNKRNGWGIYRVAKPIVGGLAVYEGQWVDDARTGKGMSKGADGHIEVCIYENGLRVGEGVRILDPSLLHTITGPLLKGEAKNFYKTMFLRLEDGIEKEEIEQSAAEAIAAKVGFGHLPTLPWPPPASVAS